MVTESGDTGKQSVGGVTEGGVGGVSAEELVQQYMERVSE